MMEEDTVLRSYRQTDLEAMYALDVICFERLFRFSRAAMRNFAEARNARVTVAERDGQLAGFCILHVEDTEVGRVGYIVTLDVAPAHRRLGVASQLMQAALEQSIGEHCVAIMLHVYTGNADAIRFYQRAGFSFVRLEPMLYGSGLDAQVWQKELVAIQ
jgi:ribosomal-protein-alanine N-acetyltransferase